VSEKPLFWCGTTRDDVRAFPAEARRLIGFQLRRVQQGFDPNDWKPMSGVGPGVREIRIRTDVQHRVFYVASFTEAIYVLHAFEKQSRKTSKPDLELARKRFRDLLFKRKLKNAANP
jgi:phage-related protein